METSEEKNERVKYVVEKINQVLLEKNCKLEPSITIIGKTIADSRIVVIARSVPLEEKTPLVKAEENIKKGEEKNG